MSAVDQFSVKESTTESGDNINDLMNSVNFYMMSEDYTKSANLPASSGSNSVYSGNTYGTPNSTNTPIVANTEYFLDNNINNNDNQQDPNALRNTPNLAFQTQYPMTGFANGGTRGNETNFSLRRFHERNRSEISEMASPGMVGSSQFYDENLGSPVRSSHSLNVGGSNFDNFEDAPLSPPDINRFLEMGEFANLGQDGLSTFKLKDNDQERQTLNSLGIAFNVAENDMSFNINENLMNELFNRDGEPQQNDFLGTLPNEEFLLPAFEEKSREIFLDPNDINGLKSSNDKKQNEKDFEEGDTTIMNSTSMMELNEAKKPLPNTDNLIGELSDCMLMNSSEGYVTDHSRTSSVGKLELPKLKPFKSPKLGSPGKISKFTNSNSFRSIPTLNEKLSFTELHSSSLNSPVSQSMPGLVSNSPTRDILVTRSPDNSYIVKAQLVPNGFVSGPMNNELYYQHFPEQTPPASPTKAMSGLSIKSPMRMSSPTRGPALGKNDFLLKPTSNARKRIATTPRSKTGCWTCRVRHKKCDEERPVCRNCSKINLKCDLYSTPKPSYMSNEEERKIKLAEIAHMWKNRGSKNSKSDLNEYLDVGDKENLVANVS